MANNDYHVVPNHGDGWNVRRSGAKAPAGNYPTQREAMDAARKLAQRSGGERVTHGRDGRIRQKESYGNDPCPPRDKR